MAITNEQLQRYWEANPQELEKAVASNPGMFGLSSQTSFNTGVPGAASQREPVGSGMMSTQGRQSPFSGIDLSSLNSAFAQQNSPEAIEQALRDRGTGFDLNSWLAEDPSRTPQQAYQQGLLSVGTASPSGSFGTGLGELGPIASGVRQEYATGLDQLLADAGRSRVEEVDGQLYALFTGQDDRFSGISTLPRGYEWAEGDRVPGEYYRVQIPEPDFFEEYIDPIVRNSIAIGGTLTGNPWLAAGTSGASTAFQGGDLEDVLQSAALGGLSVGAGNIAQGMNLTGIGSLDKALGGATVGGATAAIGGGDTRDILGSAAVGGLMQSGVLDDILPPIYSADNFAGSFVSGATNDVITQAIMTGDLSVQDALQSGLIQVGIDTVKDIYDDSGQTRNVGDMYEGGTRVDGMELDPNQLSTIRSTSDVHGLLGPDGFLSKVGLNVGEMPTSWIGNAIEFLSDSPRRTMVNIDGKEHRIIQDKNTGSWVALNPDGTLNESISANAIENAYLSGNLYEVQREGILPRTDLTAYDERFFDVTTKRSSDSPYEGIWYDPRTASRFNWTGGAVLDSTGTQIRPGGIPDSVPPPSASAPVVTRPPVDVPPPTSIEDAMDQYQDAVGDSDIDVGIDEDVEPAEDIDEEEKAENLTEEDLLGTGDTGTVGGISPDSPLQSTVDDEDFQGTGGQGGTGVEDELLGGGQGQGTLPEEEKLPSAPGSGASDIERLLAVASAVLPGGGGGGGRRRGGLFDGGKEPAKNFMAGIEYIVPMLQQMNIPLEDFLVMWMNRE